MTDEEWAAHLRRLTDTAPEREAHARQQWQQRREVEAIDLAMQQRATATIN